MTRLLWAVAAVLLVGAAPPARAPSKDPAPAKAQAAPGGPPRFAWPRLQVLEHVEASEIIEAGGIPVALRAVRVKEKLPELIQKLADAFRDGGLYVPPGPAQPQLASGVVMLTAVDSARQITYTAILQPQADGTTALYLGEANHALRREPNADGDFAPLPPGARDVLRVDSEGSRTLTFSTPLAGAEVASFYAEGLKKAGWRRAEDEVGVYTRSGEELLVVHQPGEGGLTAVVLVYRGGRAPR